MEIMVTGKTKLYAVIGDPISHSLSPEIHNKIFNELNFDGKYITLKISPEELKQSIGLLRNNFQGFNVTIPHKEAIIPLLDEIDERARIYGAVNTVKVEEGRLKGYNTDGYGFMKSLEELNVELKNKKVLILGAGGAARVIAYELLIKDCGVTIANRSEERANLLRLDLQQSTGGEIRVMNIEAVEDQYNIIVNTTPVGMSATADEMPIEEHLLEKADVVYDLIYNPNPTMLLKIAKKLNCQVINGLSMLFYQAVKAEEIWLGTSIDPSITSKILKDMIK